MHHRRRGVNPYREPIPPTACTVPATATASTDAIPSWCPNCKADSRLTGVTLLLTSQGVSTVDTWSWCEICGDDDPTDTARRPLYAR
ncbi:hypothetical protein [Actinacidiphila sp. ITFR-21]|uniref:hypothetical protein n=1 Tax=Actinacidiphila sp. ITFR-21 TaxID=3075199 RepID=UPI00288B570F|nr:hypothetical protein [Streptomyces sp. ITFR-21]WNI20405.1 hypothetical protein RLT57_32905 [Streptomyces sp. ITFR-21]